MDIPIVPLIILVVDLKEDGVVPIFVEGVEVDEDDDEVEDGLELYDLAEPEVFRTALPVIEIVDLEDPPPLLSDDDGGYDTKPRHIHRFRPWLPRV